MKGTIFWLRLAENMRARLVPTENRLENGKKRDPKIVEDMRDRAIPIQV